MTPFFTVTVHFTVLPPSAVLTVMTAVPAFTAVTFPDELTVATAVLDLDHVTVLSDASAGFTFGDGAWIYVPGARDAILAGREEFDAYVFDGGKVSGIELFCRGLGDSEKLILTEGCLMNYYAAGYGK